jgi:deoxycytidylate deaminase|tara:strand:- start:686 stop:1168 length:483 start_codon:yes stop_codon:yes gene_type:complete
MKRDSKFATLAFDQALKSTLHLKHGSVITKGSKIVTMGYNKGDRTKILGQIHSSVHAEIDAAAKLVNMLYRKKSRTKPMRSLLKDYTVWAVRVCQTDTHKKIYGMKNSRPCKCCVDKLLELGFVKVAYSDDEGNIVKSRLDNIEEHLSSSQKMYGEHYKY